MQSELNKKLLDAIGYGFNSEDGQETANECERICLQEKIDLLDDVMKTIIKHQDIWAIHGYASSQKQQLQEQLNQLK